MPAGTTATSRLWSARLAVPASFIVFLLLRVVAWANDPLLESQDSLSYLQSAKALMSLDPDRIIGLSPDATLFYPFLTAFLGSAVGSIESGARLGSLFLSCLLCSALVVIGKRIATTAEIAIGLLILAVSPFFVRFSYSVLSEPTYVAIVYLGIALFLTRLHDPRPASAALIGMVFGAGFLTRFEGILYLAAIPAFQLAHFIVTGPRRYDLRRLGIWAMAFVLSFCSVAAIQVWRVSERLGYFALNGRQTWAVILHEPGGKSYEERMFGLDYSPTQINREYLREHPEALGRMVSRAGYGATLQAYAKSIYVNLRTLWDRRLGAILGPLALVFFAFGLLEVYRRGGIVHVSAVLAFLGLGVSAPLAHDAGLVALRHFAVIGPLVILIEGMGIVALGQAIASARHGPGKRAHLIVPGLLALAIGTALVPLGKLLFLPDRHNGEYRPGDFAIPARLVHDISAGEPRRPARIAARTGYFTYFSDSKRVAVPYTDYQPLVDYLAQNHVDFLFLEHRELEDYPFLARFAEGHTGAEFERLYQGQDAAGDTLELYRFLHDTRGVMTPPGTNDDCATHDRPMGALKCRSTYL
ncbi:MAG: ArnT family glycosyltransferase [Gammaproteobacteria bacterium]